MIPTHAEALPGAPQTLRWVIPAGTLAVRGPVVFVPGPLGTLLTSGVVACIEVEPTGVLIRLGADGSWADHGNRVRTALHAALDQPGLWTGDPAQVGVGADDLLRRAVETVLAGPAGMFIRSHGGEAELLEVRDEIVTLRLRGACSGCPAVGRTLQARIDVAVRALYPGLRGVRAG